ncbi:MAG: non-canonical purine NTP pyrophosphatase [Selenomonas sp.]|nr:non-canonical purine NTP pyrophosphatase [Selenomonas sp.]
MRNESTEQQSRGRELRIGSGRQDRRPVRSRTAPGIHPRHRHAPPQIRGGAPGQGTRRRLRLHPLSRRRLDGTVRTQPRGEGGFGYDPYFYVGEKSMAELTFAEKDAISHRGRALRALVRQLEEVLA